MEELLSEQTGEIRSLKHGDVVEGSVVRIDKDEILVDIGAKSEGVVSNRELYGRNTETQPQLNIGDTVLVYVLQPESNEGHAVLSLRRAGLERKWRAMQEQFEAGVIIEAPGHRPQQGRPDRRLRHPRLRAHQPDRRLPAPAPERAAARRRPGDRREAAALRRPQAPAQDPGGQPQGQPPDPVGEGRPLRGAPREARRAVQQPQGRPAGQGHASARSRRSASSSTWAASTASSTRASSRGTRSTTPRPAIASAKRSRPRSSTSTTSAAGSACRSAGSSPTRGTPPSRTSRSATSSRARSPRSSTSAPSSACATASRA